MKEPAVKDCIYIHVDVVMCGKANRTYIINTIIGKRDSLHSVFVTKSSCSLYLITEDAY